MDEKEEVRDNKKYGGRNKNMGGIKTHNTKN